MKHAVIFAHPRAESFTATMAQAYADAAGELGHEVIVRDLYRMGFDPCLKDHEIPGAQGYRAGADVAAERALIEQAQVFAFVYPFWFNAPPAILKGYVDRVFSLGFGYEPGPGGTTSLLDGRRLISVSSSGAPDQWVRHTGALETLQAAFDMHLAAVCGLTVAGHLHFGGVGPGITDEWVAKLKGEVRDLVRERFAQPETVL